MKKLLSVAAIAALGAVCQAQEPVNPHASPRRARCCGTSTRFPAAIRWRASTTSPTPSLAGRTAPTTSPAVSRPLRPGFRFEGGADKDSTLARPELIAEAERQYRNGALVTLTWHAVRPTDDEPVTFRITCRATSRITSGASCSGRAARSQPLVRAGRCDRWLSEAVAGCASSRSPAPLSRNQRRLVLVERQKRKRRIAALYRQFFDRLVNTTSSTT